MNITTLFGIELPHHPGADGRRSGQRARHRGLRSRRARLSSLRDAEPRSASARARSAARRHVASVQRELFLSSAAASRRRQGIAVATEARALLRAVRRADEQRRRRALHALRSMRKSAEVLREFEPPVVSFHFGLPSPELLGIVKSWGAKVISSATTVAEAQWLRSERRRRDHRAGTRSRRTSRAFSFHRHGRSARHDGSAPSDRRTA